MDVAARGPGLTGLATGAVHPRERRYGSSAITPNKHPHARERRGRVAGLRGDWQTWAVKKHVLLYGLIAGVLVAALRLIEYRYLVVEHSLEIYGGLVAALFAALGIWLGLRLTRARTTVVEIRVPSTPFVRNDAAVEACGITPRELEILELIAAGLSTKEIAERVFVSENTVKTHSRRLFDKLGAKRRTQAVQLGKERGIIP